MPESRQKILIAEDHPAIAGVIQFKLKRAGFDATVVHDGQAAWDLLKEQDFDLVLTDQEMPEMTGVELCRRMRQSARHFQTPVILVTGKSFELDSSGLRDELNISEILSKPFSPRELAERVQYHLVSGVAKS